MNDFNMRQFNLMMDRIRRYQNNSLTLMELINDLESLLNIIDDDDITWKTDFRGYWWDLEQVYAISLDRENETLNLEEKKIIDKAIKELTDLIKYKIELK